jgi:NodT family efflux transporter outer membrane factor (OMF) lipoprotein
MYAHADANAKASPNRWWEGYNDSRLNGVIDEALNQNSDLAVAALNVRAAELQTHLATTNPAVAAGYTYDYSKPLQGSFSATQFHSLTASASYEVDLWGQIEAAKDVARWEARATVQDLESAELALIGTTVDLYYRLVELNYRIELSSQSIAYAEKTMRLVQVLNAAGGTSKLEIAEGEESLEGQRANQANLIEQRVELRSALTVLLNGTPWLEEYEKSSLPEGPPPPVAVGIPISLLDRRPDLRAAEFRLREALAQFDATRLSFYPNLSLTGSLGTASTGLSELVSNPLGSLATTLSLPFIQMNQAKFDTALARTQYVKAVANFRKIVLQALTDVDNSLSARRQLAVEAQSLERFLEAAKTVERLEELRYHAGSVPLQSWLDAQETRRQAEITLSANRLERLENYATLCLALGGDPNAALTPSVVPAR